MNSVHGDTAVGDQLGEQLRGVYAEVLGLPSPAHVSLDDSFFALGGDSLLSIEAVAAAAERGIAITLDQIYRRHSVRGVLHELAASADAPPPNGTPDAAQPAALPDEDLRRLPPDVVDAIPAGALQQGMILHASMYPGSTAYHDVALYHVRAPLDADALRRATARVTAEQPAFRTGFDLATYREPLQLIHRVAEVDVAVHDHLGVDPAERRAALSAWVREEHARPFDIAVPPLARIAVFDEGSSGFVLGISFHHAILDGHSLARFLRMLLSDYHACLQGGEARPANRPTADHGLSVRLERQAESSAEQLGWWRARMRDFTRTALPRTAEDGPQGGVDDEGMGRLEKSLDGALVTRLKEVARDRNVTVKHLALGVHQWVLGQVTGAGDVTSGLIVGVRPEQAGAIDQLGLFLNTVPCRTSVSGTTWVGLAQRALAAEAELLPYRRVPYAAICRTLTPPGEPSEVTFNYVHYRDYGSLEHDTGILLTPLKFHEEANFPLSAYVVESPHGAGLGIVLQYQRVLTGDAAASRMLDLYAEGFAACAASPDAPCPEPPPLAPSTDTGHPAVAEEPGTLRERAAALLGVPDAVLTAVTPAGPTQRDLYLDHLRAPDADTYCLAFTARLGPDLDRAAWERAIAEVTEEHPALRMRCAVLGEHPYLCVLSAEQALEEHAVPGWSTGPVAGAVSRAREPYRIPEDLLVRHDLVCDGGEWHAVLGAHHIALDVAGAHTVLSDVLAVYARLAGTTPPVRPGETTGRPRPRKAARQPDFDTPDTLDHWRETARHVVGVEVPAPSSAADAGSREDAAFAEERATLSGTALSRLRADCARRGVGLSSALISAYALVVGKCFGPSGDFLIHQLLAGPGAAAREVTGARYHVLPTVVPWSRRHRPGFAEELAAELHAGRRALGEHAFVSVLEQRRLLPAEGIRFVYNHYPESALAGPSGVARMEVYESYPEDEVHLIVRDFGTEVELVFRHPVRGFPPLGLPERIARVVTGLRASDEESAPASADSSGGLHALPLLSAQERDHILHRWNPTPTPHTPTTIHDLITQQAHRTPNATAIHTPTHTLTYHQLLTQAHHLAATLQHHGTTPHHTIGILAPRTPHLITALLATLLTGAHYTPLDPDYPPQRLTHIINTTHITTLLTHPPHPHITTPHHTTTIPITTPHNPTHTYTPPTTHPHDLAYIIHTSGSTGTPKGAMNQHDGVVNRLLWMRREFGIGPDDVILQKTPMSFDVSVWEFFLPLISGARMVLADPGGHRDPLHLVDLMRETGVTTAHFVPSMLRYFLAAVPASGLPGLRRIICSGEALPGDLRDLCHKVLPGVRLSNLYGPTEAAIDVTAWHCAPEDSGPAVPIGRPVDNTRVYILDEEHEPLPAGAAGELYLSGVQVGRGYAGRPALTAERFLPDPHSPVPGARMYRTGDRARLRHDGDLEFLGRLDHQIKLRGFRIELGEIEAALRDRPGVRDAAVDVQETVPGHPQLVAYVAGETAQSFSSERIRGALAEVLPAHMIPSHFVFLPELPLNSNGKLDRRALPAPEAPGNRRRQVFASDIERSIGAIWTEVLGRTDLDRTTNFFDAGGDSLLLLRVHSKLGQSVPRARELSPVDLFEFPTIGSLAELLTARETGRKAPPSQRGKLRRSMARRRIRQGGSADE